MKIPRRFLTLLLICSVGVTLPSTSLSQSERSRIGSKTEPGTLYLEDILPKPIRLVVKHESPIFYQSDMQRVLGNMQKGIQVQLVAMSEHGYRVRGRARHGDVSGWMRRQDLLSQDPKLPEKLTAFYERQQQVDALIASKEIAIGMTSQEVRLSLGNPTRKSSKLTRDHKAESYEYSVYENVPQVTWARDPYGRMFQTTVLVKVEVGTMVVRFEDNIVTEIEETKGNPLGRGGIKLLPGPIFWY